MEMRAFYQNVNALLRHPLNRGRKVAASLRVLRWQIGIRMLPGQAVFEWMGGVRAIVRRGDSGMTNNVYYGLRDFHEMAYVLHVLTSEDLFIDVGANVGAYTLLACGVSGARGYCFEPIPSTFVRLTDNLILNQLTSRVAAFNIGIADNEGELLFTTDQYLIDHVLAPHEAPESAARIPVRPLDSVIAGENPTMVKIDVEGFEAPVLSGAEKTLSNPALHSVLIEMNGSGHRYGYEDGDILKRMQAFGFAPYGYDPFSRKLSPLAGRSPSREDTLFIRDIDYVRSRVAQAPQRSIHSIEF